MKKCLTLLAIKEMQIEMAVRFHLTPVRMAIIMRTNSNECWWGCMGKRNPLYTVGRAVN
jgi:hypothetical protein